MPQTAPPPTFANPCPACYGRRVDRALYDSEAGYGQRDDDTCADCGGTGEVFDFSTPLTEHTKAAIRWIYTEAPDEWTMEQVRARIREVYGPATDLELRRRFDFKTPPVRP